MSVWSLQCVVFFAVEGGGVDVAGAALPQVHCSVQSTSKCFLVSSWCSSLWRGGGVMVQVLRYRK